MLLGIDIGTSACKAALFDFDGGVVSQRAETYPTLYPSAGFAEQNPDDWWEAVKKAIGKLECDKSKIEGIGVAGQSWAAVFVDKNRNVTANTPIWFDTRADGICRELDESFGWETFFKVGKNPLKPTYTLPKILWFKKHYPELFGKVYTVLQSNSFIVERLTGEITQDISQCYGYQTFSMGNRSFDEALSREAGLDLSLVPQVFACHQIVGRVSRRAAEQTGLKEGTPVVAGGLDAACGTLGTGVYTAGQTQEQGGQAGGMSICLDEIKADPRLIFGAHVVKDLWLLQGGTTGGGGVLNWFRTQLGGSFSELDAMAESVSAGSEGVVFLPYMAGERSPIWDENAKGVFYGLDFSKTKGHLARAAMEGVCFSLRHNLEIAAKAGAKADVLYSTGGAANSAFWTQLKSDITGRHVKVASADTTTTLGAAMLAGVGTGVYGSFEEAVERCVEVRREYMPNTRNDTAYNDSYSLYLEIYEKLRETMSKRM